MLFTFDESEADEVWNTKKQESTILHPASRPFGVRVRPHCVQLGLVESGRERFHFQKRSTNCAAYSEFFSSPWWQPGLRCWELGARHPWVELQPDLRLIFLICLVLHSTYFIWMCLTFGFDWLLQQTFLPCPPCRWYSRRCEDRCQSEMRKITFRTDIGKDKDSPWK